MVSLKSGHLAKLAHVNTETLRYYEREGLLPEPERSDAGYRLYTQEDVKRVQFIKRAQELGFSLKEIKELLALRLGGEQSAALVKEITEQKIHDIRHKILDLEAMKAALLDLSAACSGKGTVGHCPILKSLDNL